MISAAVTEAAVVAGMASIQMEGRPDVMWILARRFVELRRPVAVLPGEVLLVGAAGDVALPAVPSVELRFSLADLPDDLELAADKIVRQLADRGFTA